MPGRRLDLAGKILPETRGFKGTVLDWYSTINDSIQELSELIHKQTLQSGASLIVVEENTFPVISHLGEFRPYLADDDKFQDADLMGTLDHRWNVYKTSTPKMRPVNNVTNVIVARESNGCKVVLHEAPGGGTAVA